MDEAGQGIVEPTNSSQSEQHVPMKPDKLVWIIPSLALTIVVLMAGMYFLSTQRGMESFQQGYAEQTIASSTEHALPVDHATYVAIRDSKSKLPDGQEVNIGDVIENSLQLYDIDGDGDQDVIGFRTVGSESRFSTWYKQGASYNFYRDFYYEFRFNTAETSCTIADVALKSVSLACTASGHEYPVALRYQEATGEGYYTDVRAHALTFDGNTSWREYVSKKSGIQFSYPPDVTIAEKTFKSLDRVTTVITGTQNEKILFEIHSLPYSANDGGGVIDSAWKGVFLKLSDGTYLSRDLLPSDTDGQPGVFYKKTDTLETNNAGSIFNSYSGSNVVSGRKYILFTEHTTDTELKEIDNIFASIHYLPAVAGGTEATPLQENTVSLANAVTLTVPGRILEKPVSAASNTIASKYMTLTFIDSPIYEPAHISIELYPFGSVGGINRLGGGGYDQEKGVCFTYDKHITKPPERIGAYETCRFGWGDGGYSTQGYFVLDPKRKYILRIAENIDAPAMEVLSPDLKKIVEGVQFLNQ